MTIAAVSPTTLVPGVMPAGPNAGKTSEKILLDTATGEHVCAACGHRAPGFHNILGHMAWKHRTNPEKKPGRKLGKTAPKPDLAARIDQIGALLNDVRSEFVDVTDEKVDASWKKRAQDAERRLATLRRALGGGESA